MPRHAESAQELLAGRILRQADGCEALGAPFSAELLRAAAADQLRGGPAWDVLAGFESEDADAALALRLLAAVHRLVLSGRLPELVRHFPSTGGDGDAGAAAAAMLRAFGVRRAEFRALVARPCQTNEVARSCALLGGFLEVARRTSLPLRLLEVGASAGLNLRWDRYRYDVDGRGWGDPGSPVHFRSAFETPPSFDARVEVADRSGCDLNPIDATSAEGSLTLRSFVWTDHLERLHLLEAAIGVARATPARVERLDAEAFLVRELAQPRPGVATVVYHSVFIQYLDAAGKERLRSTIRNAVESSKADSPVAHLAMEPPAGRFEDRAAPPPFEVRLNGRLVGTSGPHGTEVRWLAS